MSRNPDWLRQVCRIVVEGKMMILGGKLTGISTVCLAVILAITAGCKSKTSNDTSLESRTTSPGSKTQAVVIEGPNARDSALDFIPVSIQRIHDSLLNRLSAGQIQTLSGLYPGFRIVGICSGHFGDKGQTGFVFGVWKSMKAESWWKRDLHRIGLIRDGGQWKIHVIDDEIEKDEDLSRVSPMVWSYTVADSGFAAEMKCGVDLDRDSSLSFEGHEFEKPLFDLGKEGLQEATPACFATDQVYNNWDCIVYDSKKGRFRLWYQQASSD